MTTRVAATVRHRRISRPLRVGWMAAMVLAGVGGCAESADAPGNVAPSNTTVVGSVTIHTEIMGGSLKNASLNTTTRALSADVVGGLATVSLDGGVARVRAFVSASVLPKHGPLADTTYISDSTHGVSRLVMSRSAYDEPVSRIEQTTGGTRVAAVDLVWKHVRGGVLLSSETVTAYHAGKAIARLDAQFATNLVESGVLSVASLRRVTRRLSRALLPTPAYADDDVRCGGEALVATAAGWGAEIACAGGVLLLTPQCGAALLAYTGACWILADCMKKVQPT